MRPRRSMLGALALAGVGAVGIAFAVLDDPARALIAWVAAFGFGLGTVLAALILVMTFHVTRASWPVVLKPLLEGITATTPLFAVLFVPVALGVRPLYPWGHPTVVAEPELAAALEHQRAWNNPTFFLVRAAFYFVVWIVLSGLLRRVDRPTEDAATRTRLISAVGIPVLAFTLTFAAFDWFMSLEPGWVANMYGLYLFAGGLASALSVVALLAWMASRSGRIEGLRPDHFHAIGRLMLMATVFWAYIGFFQLMLVWIANLPREASFFVARARGTYLVVDVVLLLGHFILPFFLLLSRPLKRRAGPLALVGAWIVVMNAVDVAWLVLPSLTDHLRVLDAAPFLFVAGIALAFGLWRSRTVPAAAPDALLASLEYRSS